jgi:hypothetical protein
MIPADTDLDAPAGDAVREQPPRPGHAANRIVPEAVAARFLRIGERYFLPDRSLAFVDAGTRLQVLTHNLEVLHGVVAILMARGWQQVQVTGTPAFRQLLWREATLQGIEVHGHRPDALELQQLTRMRARRAAAAQRPARDPPGTAEDGPARGEGRWPVRGILLAHAAAPYRFDPAQRLSYYARLRTDSGERTLWGTDLERAIVESRSGVQVGDEVVVRPRGARPVTVRFLAPGLDGGDGPPSRGTPAQGRGRARRAAARGCAAGRRPGAERRGRGPAAGRAVRAAPDAARRGPGADRRRDPRGARPGARGWRTDPVAARQDARARRACPRPRGPGHGRTAAGAQLKAGDDAEGTTPGALAMRESRGPTFFN